ncbi:MAG: transcription initiation protein [Planctomycetes bacterium]|nr:transcription initiation protein [Planctomycetota bacterium]
MLALHEDPTLWADMSPEDMQRIIESYGAWARKMGEEGHLRGGQKLKDEPGRVLRKTGSGIKTVDGPYSETKEILGGFFIIAAKDYDEAARVAASCPHVLNGGTIELREIDPVEDGA